MLRMHVHVCTTYACIVEILMIEGRAYVNLVNSKKEERSGEIEMSTCYKFESSSNVRSLVVKGWEST